MSLILSGTDGLSDVDGSAATPAIRGTDANTGIFFPAADTIAFAEGGAEVMRIDSSGNVGIGTSSPSGRVHAVSAPGTVQVKWSDATNGTANLDTASGVSRVWSNVALAFGTGAESFTERARIDTSGNLLVGTTSNGSGAKMKIATATRTAKFFDLEAIGGENWIIDNNNTSGSTDLLGFYASGSTGMYLSDTGNLLVGTTSLTAGNSKLTVKADGSGNSGISANSAGTGAYNIISIENGNGQVGRIQTNGSATSYLTSSDYRLKESISPMVGALAKVTALKPCIYKWKVDGADGEGFIAHELAEIVPSCVGGEKDAVDAEGNPVYQGIDTSFLVATLTAAIQEQQALIQSLTDRITALETPPATPPVNEQPA